MATRQLSPTHRRQRRFPHALTVLALAGAAVFAGLGGAALDAQTRPRLFIVQYDLVAQTPVSGGTDYEFRARLYNFGPAVPGATAHLTGSSTAGLPIDGTLVFGPIGRNQGAWSSDTATFRRTGRWRALLGDFRWTIVAGTVNRAPVANAGADRPASPGDTVTLDGSGSSDADGDLLTYAWTLLSAPPGSAAVLQGDATVAPRVVADLPGDYVVQLVVNDGTTDSMPDSVTISTRNTSPVAAAGPDQTVVAGLSATLDGSASYDVDGDALTYRWTLSSAPAGSGVTIANPFAPLISFVTDRPGDYVLQLVVNDGLEDSAADSVTVSTTNSAPVANAGPDQVVPLGATVTLDGTVSSDADSHPIAFSWTMSSAPGSSTVALTGGTTATPQFTPDVAGTYVVQLIVHDGFVDGAPDTVRIDVVPPLPTVTIAAVDASAAELGRDPGVVRVSRTGANAGPLRVILATSGSAGNGVDYEPLGGASFEVDIPAGESFVDVVITPRPDNLVERPDEVATVGMLPGGTYVIGPQGSADVTIADDPPVVTLVAADAAAAESGPDGRDTGRFDITRTGGDQSVPLAVDLRMSGTATAGVDYEGLTGAPVSVVIPANQSTVSVFIVPIADAVADPNETAVATLVASAGYIVGSPDSGTVTIR